MLLRRLTLLLPPHHGPQHLLLLSLKGALLPRNIGGLRRRLLTLQLLPAALPTTGPSTGRRLLHTRARPTNGSSRCCAWRGGACQHSRKTGRARLAPLANPRSRRAPRSPAGHHRARGHLVTIKQALHVELACSRRAISDDELVGRERTGQARRRGEDHHTSVAKALVHTAGSNLEGSHRCAPGLQGRHKAGDGDSRRDRPYGEAPYAWGGVTLNPHAPLASCRARQAERRREKLLDLPQNRPGLSPNVNANGDGGPIA